MKELVLAVLLSSAIGFGQLEWSEPTSLWSDTIHVQNHNIIETPDGKILAAWALSYPNDYQTDSTKVFLRVYDGQQWSPLVGNRLTLPLSFNSPFPLGLDKIGNLWTIGMVDTSVYALCSDGDTWSEPEWIWDAQGLPPRLIDDTKGKLWAVLNRWTDSSYFHITHRDSAGWSFPELWAQTEWCMGGGDFWLVGNPDYPPLLVWGGLELVWFKFPYYKEVLIPYAHTCQPVRGMGDLDDQVWFFFQLEFDSLTIVIHSQGPQRITDTVFPSSRWYHLSCCNDSNGTIWVSSAQDTGSLCHIVFRSYDPTMGKWSAIVEYNPMPNWSEYNPVLLATRDKLWMVWNGDSGTARRIYVSYADLPVSITESLPACKEASLSITPNPVRDKTIIRFTLPRREYCRLVIYDQTGRVNTVLGEGWLAAGGHRFLWERKLTTAEVYFCFLESTSHTMQEKIVVIE